MKGTIEIGTSGTEEGLVIKRGTVYTNAMCVFMFFSCMEYVR